MTKLLGCGIWPVTMATTLLKTGGYQRFTQVADKVEGICPKKWEGIDVDALKKLAADAITDGHHVKKHLSRFRTERAQKKFLFWTASMHLF